MSSTFSGDETASFFGFLGATAALVFSCVDVVDDTAVNKAIEVGGQNNLIRTVKSHADSVAMKAEKTELHEEKLLLNADKEKMEQEVKAATVLTVGFVPPPPVACHTKANKMIAFTGHGRFPNVENGYS
ncbi:hypothetical protein NE237_018686 [Protea cynaroides]|uniref:Uncharacterized protein n=1 Tax=Protea cynaroides TaxID=273540 RepID=A0A9Q0QP81_9MAGN|nr:hypothetical protein NE237_018686 [Protea cynaroides]